MNVRRRCGEQGIVEEIGRLFERRGLDILDLHETNMKGKGREILCLGVEGWDIRVKEKDRVM